MAKAFVSYRTQRMAELRKGIADRHGWAGKYVTEVHIKPNTPVGTPASTKKADYPITMQLRNSIRYNATSDYVDMGSSLYYAPYVHQGTYDVAHGYHGWVEPTAQLAWNAFFHNDQDVTGIKGALPRPFLVIGLMQSRPFLKRIYNRPIN